MVPSICILQRGSINKVVIHIPQVDQLLFYHHEQLGRNAAWSLLSQVTLQRNK